MGERHERGTLAVNATCRTEPFCNPSGSACLLCLGATVRQEARVCYVRRRAPSFHYMVSEPGSDPGGPPGRWRGRGRHRGRIAATTPTSTALVLAVLAVCVAWECAVAVRCRVEVAAWEDSLSLQAAVDGLKAGEWRLRGWTRPRSGYPASWVPGCENGPATLGMGAAMLLFPGAMVRRKMATKTARRKGDASRSGGAARGATWRPVEADADQPSAMAVTRARHSAITATTPAGINGVVWREGGRRAAARSTAARRWHQAAAGGPYAGASSPLIRVSDRPVGDAAEHAPLRDRRRSAETEGATPVNRLGRRIWVLVEGVARWTCRTVRRAEAGRATVRGGAGMRPEKATGRELNGSRAERAEDTVGRTGQRKAPSASAEAERGGHRLPGGVSRVSRVGHGCPARGALTMENSGRGKPRKVLVESRNCVEAAPSRSTRPRGAAELCARADGHGTGERGETGAGNDGTCQLVIGAGARFAAGRAASAMSGTCCARDCSKAATPVQNCCHADAHYSTPVANTVTSAVTTSTVSVETTPMTYGDTKEIKRPISGNYLQSIRANYPVTGPQGTGCCGEGNNIEAPLKGQFTNDTVGGGIFNEASRVDDRSRLEQLLVMSGIERHPGPEMGYRPEPMTTLTHDACVWVFDTAVWTAKTDKFADRVRAVLKHFMPGSMPHRRIARLATEASALTGEGMTEALRWQEFQSMVRQLLPHNALSEQDYLARMSRRAKEPWLDFMDRYSLYADTCKKVTEAIKAAELFRKLPHELRLQLTHVKHDATLTELMEAVRGVRYWQNCAQDKSIQFDPMELDSHAHRAHSSEDFDALVDVPAEDLGFRQGDSRGFGRGDGGSAGRFQRPVLRGDTINFRNIDGPRSLMTAWKKLVSTSPSFRREASEFLSRTKQRKSLHDQEVEFGEDFGRIQADFVDGEEDF